MATLQERLAHALSDRYILDREIGSGGMGVVFEGRNARLESKVAIKALRPELATAELEASFQREARLLAKLSHPNIVTVHDADVAAGVRYYVMDFIEGETVAERLMRGPMEETEVLRLASDLLDALETVHRLGIVHRDIKPSNIVLVEGRAVLVDFGIAHVDATVSERTQTGVIKGTPAYLTPEQREGRRVTAQTDQYALAMVLYECVTGELWRPVRDVDEGNWVSVPRSLARPLRRALQWKSEARWPDVRAFKEALAPGGRRSHTIWLQWLAFAALIVAIGLILVWIVDGRDGAGGGSDGAVDLAIAPFEVVGADPVEGEELAATVRRRLGPIPDLDVVEGDGRGTTASLHATGTLTREDDRWTLDFGYVDSTRGGLIPSRYVIEDDRPTALADSAAIEIVRQYFKDFRDRIRMPSHDLEALGNWFRGEIAFQQDLWYPAEGYFTAALREDPNFALAAWRLYNARQWGRRPVEIDLAQLYWDNRDNPDAFSPLDLELIRAELEPDLRTRLRIYETTLDSYSTDYYSALQRGNELFHRGPLIGFRLEESLDALGEAQRLEPQLAPSYNQTLWATIRLGRADQAEAALAQRKRITTTPSLEDVDASLLFEWAYHERFHPETAQHFRTLVMTDPTSDLAQQVASVFRIALSLDIPGAQAELGAWMATADGFDGGQRANGHLGAGLARIMMGQPLAGLDHLDRAVWPISNDAELVAEQARLLLPLYGIPIPEDERTRARGILVELSHEPTLGRRARWTLALDAWHRGDTLGAAEWTSGLGPRGERELRISLHDVLEVLDLGRRDPRAAVDRSRRLTAADSAGRGTDPFVRSLLYWHRAQWLEGLEEWREAERTWLWYENSDFGFYPNGVVQAAEIDWMVGSFARLERAELQLRWPNRVVEACRHLARLLELWREAEPAVAGHRDRAQSLADERCPA